MRKHTFYGAFGLAAAGTFVYVSSPYWLQDFDERNAPEAPPLSALTLVTSTASDAHIAQNTISDEAIDVRAYHVISGPQIYRRWKRPDGE